MFQSIGLSALIKHCQPQTGPCSKKQRIWKNSAYGAETQGQDMPVMSVSIDWRGIQSFLSLAWFCIARSGTEEPAHEIHKIYSNFTNISRPLTSQCLWRSLVSLPLSLPPPPTPRLLPNSKYAPPSLCTSSRVEIAAINLCKLKVSLPSRLGPHVLSIIVNQYSRLWRAERDM